MPKPTADLIQIVTFGGGVVLDGRSTSTEDLCKIASFAAGKGSRVIVKSAGDKPTADLVRIATFGQGVVILDFTE